MHDYTDIRTTPLRFHKFYWKIWIPVQVILGGWNFGKLSADFSAVDLYAGIDMAHYLISGVLFAAAMGGFFRWKRSALICVFAQMAENIIYVLAMFVMAQQMGGDTAFALSAVIGTLIRCIPVGIYYYNRRKLFVKGGYTRQQMAAINNGADNSFAGSFKQSSNTYNNMYGNGYNTYSNTNGYGAQQTDNADETFAPDADGLTRFCPHCGKHLPNSPNFCIYCGAKLK